MIDSLKSADTDHEGIIEANRRQGRIDANMKELLLKIVEFGQSREDRLNAQIEEFKQERESSASVAIGKIRKLIEKDDYS